MGIKRTLSFFVVLAFLLVGASVALKPPAPEAPSAAAPVAKAPSPSSEDAASEENDAARDTERARELLEESAATYEHLEDVTVRVGPTPKGEQAVAYYTEGEILVSPDHADSIEKIMAHEIWHVIDWRDNGQMDWGESLPPSNAADYLK